jgi:hypothetical protein
LVNNPFLTESIIDKSDVISEEDGLMERVDELESRLSNMECNNRFKKQFNSLELDLPSHDVGVAVE